MMDKAIQALMTSAWGWKGAVLGGVLGLVLLVSSVDQDGRAQVGSETHTARAVTSVTASPPVMPEERRVALSDGRELVLAADGAQVTLRHIRQRRVIGRYPLNPIRIGASLTRLPSGQVLLWGGLDAGGRLVAEGQRFDPRLAVWEPLTASALTPRAGHTATVLSDGRVLFVGGRTTGAPAELWDETEDRVSPVEGAEGIERSGHDAQLRADGRVALTEGRAAMNATAETPLVFDPASGHWQAEPVTNTPLPALPAVAASYPAQGTADVAPEARFWVRFDRPMRVTELTEAQVTLVGPNGTTQLAVNAVEDGRLMFIQPRQPLFPGSRYTLFVDGVHAQGGVGLPMVVIDFQTEARPGLGDTPTEAAVPEPDIAGCPTEDGYPHPCAAQGTLEDGVWTPGRDNTRDRWRVSGAQPELPVTDVQSRLWAQLGWRVVQGQIQRIDQVPVADVEVSIGELQTRTDAQGRFQLFGVPSGHQELYVDGTTANRPGFEYGQFVIGLEVETLGLTQIPYTMYLPRITERDKIRIASPLRRDVTLTHPDMPGLRIEIPADVVIRDRKGRLVEELAIVPTPVNRAPFPVADNYPMYFTLEPGGAIVQPLTPVGAKGVRVFYPNYDQHPAGTVADFWIYDPSEGWRVYGQGRVEDDGQLFAPEPGVALHQTMGGSYSVTGEGDANPYAPICPQGCGSQTVGDGQSATGADPIDLKNGTFFYSETDIVLNDIVPLSLSRHYQPHDTQSYEFGYGTRANFGYRLSRDDSSYNRLWLVLPSGASIPFDRESGSGVNGVWRQTGSPTGFSGARLEGIIDNGHKFRLTFRDGRQMQFHNYAPNYLLWEQDRFGNRTEYQRDAGLVTRIVSPGGRYIALDYDSQNRIRQARDHSGRIWQYEYNDEGMLRRVIHPDTSYRVYTYDTLPRYRMQWVAHATKPGRYVLGVTADGKHRLHRLRSVYDSYGREIVRNAYADNFTSMIGATPPVDYAGRWRVQRQTRADGGHYAFTYELGEDFLVTAATVTNPDGFRRRVEYSEDSIHPVRDIGGDGTPLAQAYTFERDSAGRLTARIDPLNRRTEYQRDTHGQITATTTLAGTNEARTVRYAYNGTGDVVRITDPLQRITHFDYENGCLVRITNPLGQSVRQVCNSFGQPMQLISPLNQVTTLAYQGFQVSRITGADGRSTQLRWDNLGRLLAVEDAQGQIGRREYDVMDRPVRTVTPSGAVTAQAYDLEGRVSAVLLPHGNGVTYDYDEQGRLIRRTDSLNQVEQWRYDAGDRPLSYTDRKGQVTQYAYDALGRLAVTTYADGSTVTATYDAGDRLVDLLDSRATRLRWYYDSHDQVLTADHAGHGMVHYTYDAAGRRTSMRPAQQAQVEYRYDAGDRLIRLLQGTETVQFAYDAGNRPTRMTLPNGVQTDYVWDVMDRLTRIDWRQADETVLGDLTYGYDTLGQIVHQGGSFAPQRLPDTVTDTAFDDNNRQTRFEDNDLVYDANGNLVSDGQRTYVWNVRNQLAEIRENGVTVGQYWYDALGRRISKNEAGQMMHYLYDGHDIVQEREPRAEVPIRPVLTGLGIDQRYARTESDGRRTYFLTDHLGSTRALTDATGTVIQRYDYTPYGQTYQTASGFSNPYRYTGRELDQSGLYYYRARYYSADMGRFISEDPIGLWGGWNYYTYVLGNPLSWSDPEGEAAAIFPIVLVGGGVLITGTLILTYWKLKQPSSEPWDNDYGGRPSSPIENPLWHANGASNENECPPSADAPGKPSEEDGYFPPKRGDSRKIRSPNGRGYGWLDKDGNVWVPTGPGSNAHGGPHWDVQNPNGGYENVYPGGRKRGGKK